MVKEEEVVVREGRGERNCLAPLGGVGGVGPYGHELFDQTMRIMLLFFSFFFF